MIYFQNGALMISAENAAPMIDRFGKDAASNNQTIVPIEFGSLNQLKNLVHLVSTGEVIIPIII